MRITRRRLVGFFGSASVAVVAFGVAAYACTNLASLNLSSNVGKVGDRINVTGSSFGAICVCGPQVAPTPVKIRWHGIKGEVMAEVMPDRAGTVSAAFTVPDVKPGYYVIVATQHDETWNIDAAGTPARATFEVLTATGQSVVGSGQLASASTPDESTSSGLIALTVALGALGLGLFAGGSMVVVRQVVGRRAPVPAPVGKD